MTFPVLPQPAGIDIVRKRTVLASSLRQVPISGAGATVQPLWPWPRYQVELTINLATARAAAPWGGSYEWQVFEDFWKDVMFAAPGGVFAYEDPEDSVAAAQSIGIGDGLTAAWQLRRALSSFPEPVLAPVASDLVVNIAGSPTSAYTLGDYGVITFASAPGTGQALTWSGTYRWLCQFDQDGLEESRFMQRLFQLNKISFTTWRN